MEDYSRLDDVYQKNLELVREEEQQYNLKQDVYATWVATGVVVAVLGVQFSSRPNVTDIDRQLADIAFLIYAIFLLIWQTLMMYAPGVTRQMMMIGNVAFVSLIILLLVVLIVGTSKNKFG
jgi:NADH:ubiquinone oxidoreductase subunit 3 (subunit A)